MQTGKSMIVHMPIDSVESLEDAELPPGASRAIVRVITNHVTAAVSGLASKDDLERLRAATNHRFDEARIATQQGFSEARLKTDHDINGLHVSFDEFRVGMRQEFASFRAEMRQESATFQAEMKQQFAEFRDVMRQEFAKLQVEIHRQMFKWFLGFLGVMLPAYTSLVFFVVQYAKK